MSSARPLTGRNYSIRLHVTTIFRRRCCSQREHRDFLLAAMSRTLLIISIFLGSLLTRNTGRSYGTRNIERGGSIWVRDYFPENLIYGDHLLRSRFGIPRTVFDQILKDLYSVIP